MSMTRPVMTFFELLTSRVVSIVIAKNKGMLHMKWKLKSAALQIKYV